MADGEATGEATGEAAGEAAGEKPSTPIVESRETDGQPAKEDGAEKLAENTLTDQQTRAIAAIIETIYRHRLSE